jgi:hypothetical protein
MDECDWACWYPPMPTWEFRSAFPASLALPVTRVTARLGPTDPRSPARALHVVVDGEALAIPYRFSFAPGSLAGAQALPAEERLVLMCIFSRHHDGHVREECLRAIVGRPEPWVAPFVIQPLGEYVMEIIQVVRSSLDTLNRAGYKRFVDTNRPFLELTRQRAISYWNIYFRRQFPDRIGCPSFEVLDHLDAL